MRNANSFSSISCLKSNLAATRNVLVELQWFIGSPCFSEVGVYCKVSERRDITARTSDHTIWTLPSIFSRTTVVDDTFFAHYSLTVGQDLVVLRYCHCFSAQNSIQKEKIYSNIYIYIYRYDIYRDSLDAFTLIFVTLESGWHVLRIWQMQIWHDASLALVLYFPTRPSPPLLCPASSPASFISAVRKLLTLLHTCKPERVKAFHKFFIPLKKKKKKSSSSSDGFLKTRTHTHVKPRQLWDLNLFLFCTTLYSLRKYVLFWQPHGGGKVRKVKKAEEEELKSK